MAVMPGTTLPAASRPPDIRPPSLHQLSRLRSTQRTTVSPVAAHDRRLADPGRAERQLCPRPVRSLSAADRSGKVDAAFRRPDVAAPSTCRTPRRSCASTVTGALAAVGKRPGGNPRRRSTRRTAPLTTTVPVTVRDVESHPQVGYTRDIAPIFSKAGCNMGACHAAAVWPGRFQALGLRLRPVGRPRRHRPRPLRAARQLPRARAEPASEKADAAGPAWRGPADEDRLDRVRHAGRLDRFGRSGPGRAPIPRSRKSS